MDFIKSSLAKKIILILIAILLFNFAIPQEVKAAGKIVESILFKPLASLMLIIVVSVETVLGILINGVAGGFGEVGTIVDKLQSGDWSGANDEFFSQLFVGPDTIFAGKIPILNANIFTTVSQTNPFNIILNGASAIGSETVGAVREAIAAVYVLLRNICGLAMLCGLIYTGIQILISSNIPTKKTQYLMLIQDWVIGMALLIFSHIVMILVFYISDEIITAFQGAVGSSNLNWTLIKQSVESIDNDQSSQAIISLVLVGYMIYLTGFYAIAYFKRFLWTGILIVISPVVSVMYVFGQQTKQIYSKWLREYIMNVFIQPFHIIVYYVLVAVPVIIVGHGNFNNLFSIVYAILSIALMKHFEKYIRDLFGFQGMSAQASLESGRATFNAAREKIEDVRDKAAAVGMVAAKAMAGIPPSEGEIEELGKKGNDSGYFDGLIMDHKELDEEGRPTIKTRDEYIEAYGEEAFNEMLERNGHTVPRDETGTEEIYGNGSGEGKTGDGTGYPIGKPGEQLDELEYAAQISANAMLADATMDSTGADFKEAIAQGVEEGNENTDGMNNGKGNNNAGNEEVKTSGAIGAGDASNNEELQELEKEKRSLSGQKSGISRKISRLDEEYRKIAPEAMNGFEDDEESVGKKDRANEILRQRAELVSQRDAISERQSEIKGQITSLKETSGTQSNSDEKGSVSSSSDSGSGSASSSSDTGSGSVSSSSDSGNSSVSSSSGAGNSIGSGSSGSENSSVSSSSGGGSNMGAGSGAGGTITAGNVTINAGSIKIEGQLSGAALQGARAANAAEILSKDNDDKEKIEAKVTDHDDELSKVSITGGKNGFNIDDSYFTQYQKLEKAGARGRVANEIYKGANAVLDTFAISPADTSWKQTADIRERRIGRSEEKRHAEMERVKSSWAGDKTNIQTLAAQFMPQMREVYAGKPEAYIKMQAEEKAKGRLKEMAEFLPYGITDVHVAHKLYEDQRNFGLTPIETIRERAAFEKFDNQAGNVSNINVSNQYVGNNYQTVSQAIPGAREYYNAGYSQVDQMMWLDFMASRLNKTPDMAIKIDQTLRQKGGKINYNGSNKELQEVIRQINKHYS